MSQIATIIINRGTAGVDAVVDIANFDSGYIIPTATALASTSNVTAIDLDTVRANEISLTENTVLTPSNGARGQSAIFYINSNASNYTCGVSVGKLVANADFTTIATLGASEIAEIVLSYTGSIYLWRLNIIDVS